MRPTPAMTAGVLAWLACAAQAGRPPAAEGNRPMRRPPPPRGYTIPTVDLAAQTHRQVIVDREKGQYLGHPSTVLLEDGRTILCVYPKGHGRGAIVMKRSTDGGRTWSRRLPVPKSWATSKETPTIHRVVDAKGTKRLILFSGLYPIRMAVSRDDGSSWGELKPIGDFGGIVAMGDVVPLKRPGEYLAMFHDDGRFFRKAGRRTDTMTVYTTLSTDGGLTWGPPRAILRRRDVHLCEPGTIRSPDGRQIAVLFRENRRRRNSHVIFSDDEGQTWTEPRELPGALTGDRHKLRYAPDGRIVATFRDTTLESPTAGDWVAWVGAYEDIVRGREGQCRVRLMDNHRGRDCAYPGLELLPDGTFVTTTYGHWTRGESPYVVSVRFKLKEIDALAKKARPEMIDVFAAGAGGYPAYRIPCLVATTRGTLLAICEGRQTLSDHAKNDIVLRRSADGGRTWSAIKVIHEDGDNSLNNPCAVVEPRGRRVLLFLNRFARGYHTHNCVPGYTDRRANRVYLVTSDDDGASWSKPGDVTRQLKRPKVRFGISTPGTGIVLRRGRHAGRLIVPMIQCHGTGRGLRRSYVAYSDDRGKTWHVGREAPVDAPEEQGSAAEPTVVERADGTLLMNCRNNSPRRPSPCRRAATSRDAGETWSEMHDVPELIEPNCQGSLLRHTDPLDGLKSRILFSNPASKQARRNGTIRMSIDEGRTWPVARTLWPGGYAYSSLASLPDGSVGCLFEKDGYKTVTFARFTLAWLTDGKDAIRRDSPGSPASR